MKTSIDAKFFEFNYSLYHGKTLRTLGGRVMLRIREGTSLDDGKFSIGFNDTYGSSAGYCLTGVPDTSNRVLMAVGIELPLDALSCNHPKEGVLKYWRSVSPCGDRVCYYLFILKERESMTFQVIGKDGGESFHVYSWNGVRVERKIFRILER